MLDETATDMMLPPEAAESEAVAALPALLAFVPGSGLDELRRRFVLLTSDALGRQLATIAERDADACRKLDERTRNLPPDGLIRLLLAPETVHRLLWPELHRPDEIARFLTRAVEAEHARCGKDYELDVPTWTALGDALVGGGQDVITLTLDNFPPIVLGDPALRHPTAETVAASDAGGMLPEEALSGVVGGLLEARARLHASGEQVWAFARDLNTTLVLRADGSSTSKALFRSSSPERYIGRSNLWNPHSPEVTSADLAEAIVHEAIHTVLDSVDALLTRGSPQPPGSRWVTEPRLYDGISRTVSAWTGRELDVPTYIHAYLVWYGLLCFWTRALAAHAFDPAEARQRIKRAGAPFIARTAMQPIRPYINAVRPDVALLLQSIEDHVAEQFDDLVLK